MRAASQSPLFVMIPFSVLRRVNITPEPPPLQAEAFHLIPSGYTSRGFGVISSKYWEQDGLEPSFFSDETVKMLWTYRPHPGEDFHRCTVVMTGAAAMKIDLLPDADARSPVEAQMARMRPSMAGKITITAWYGWGRDPLAQGCRHIDAPGQVQRFAKAMISRTPGCIWPANTPAEPISAWRRRWRAAVAPPVKSLSSSSRNGFWRQRSKLKASETRPSMVRSQGMWMNQGADRSLKAAHISAAAALLVLGALVASPALSADRVADPVHGAKLFFQCRACHVVGQGDASGVGPNLWGVLGAKAGTRPDYRYSAALSSSGIVWSAATLDQWLTQPTALVPGTKMAFQGVASPQARADLIAYLMTLGPTMPNRASP